MLKVKINTSVENGRLKSNRKTLTESIKQFEGKNITITIERRRKTRSNEQNRYYWGVIIPITQSALKEATGERKTKEEVHEFFKKEFNYTEIVNESTGEIKRIGRSTTENSTIVQEEFYEDCRRFVLEWFDVIIPLPNENLELNLETE